MPEPRRQQMIRQMVGDLESLPEDRLEEVRDFVDFLKRKASRPRRGSPEALLGLFGGWDGPPGELDRLTEEIYQARHQEDD